MSSDFRDRAACRDCDPELFFPVGERGPARRQAAEAVLVCRRCLVTAECLAWALQTGQLEGVWGGHTATERRTLRQQDRHTKRHREPR